MLKHKPKSKTSLLMHMASQKFAALVFCVAVLFVAAFFLTAAAFGNLALAVTGLYTAFVGGRAWSDGQVLKFGGTLGTAGDTDQASAVGKLPVKPDKDDDKQEEEID